MNRQDLYLSAMRGADGTINVGYLVLFRSGRAVIIVCFVILALGIYSIFVEHSNTAAILGAVGDAIAKIIGAFGILLAALGAYLWGDSKQLPPVDSKVTNIQSTEVKTA